jgi:hypothetical protein
MDDLYRFLLHTRLCCSQLFRELIENIALDAAVRME